jgi:ferredoxin--NADP+ reductase
MLEPERYAVAVVGGATAGAEAARIFAERGILTVVFDMNERPYGKVEDGLPRWHVNLRKKEYASIDRKLTLPHVEFIPKTKMGADFQMAELTRDWGFHAVVLAMGAWKDRPFPVEGADRYVGSGLVYQNAFIHWFNHCEEPGYQGETYPILDGTIVVGGGLASIDVAKAIQFELVRRALGQRDLQATVEELEVNGVPKTLEKHGLAWEDLDLQGCTIFYRRRIEDMPLAEAPAGADRNRQAKVEATRRRILEKSRAKYLFQVRPLLTPTGLIVENDRLVGLDFAKTRVDGGRLTITGEIVSVRSPMVISSIGSIPEPLPSIAMKGELYDFSDREFGRFEAHPSVFSAGNVVTGKGNLAVSRKHAQKVASHMVSDYLRNVADFVLDQPPLSDQERESLRKRIHDAQRRVGYRGDYQAWIQAVSPPDLA